MYTFQDQCIRTSNTKHILDIMLPVRRIKQSSLVSLEMLCLSIFCAYILPSRIYFSQVYCLFFKPTSSFHKSILFESLVYFLSLHSRFVGKFQLSLLSIFQAYILVLRGVYFSRVKLNYTQAGRDTVTFYPISNSRWQDNRNRVSSNQSLADQSVLFGMRSFSSIGLMKSRVY